MTIDIEKNKLIVTFKYDPIFVEIIKEFPDRKFIKKTKNWSVPVIHIKEVLDTLLPLQFITSERVNELYVKRTAYVNKIRRVKEGKLKTSELKILTDINLPLYDYQKIGASFLCVVHSGLLGDEPGTGKTIQSLAATVIRQSKKTLILCPASIKQTWYEEIEKWLPNKTAIVIKGDKKHREKLWAEDKEYYIVNYELLLRDLAIMQSIPWDFKIADEATRISNPKAKSTIAIKKIKAKYTLALTGTPFNNTVQDIWSILDFCQSGLLGSFWQFTEKYCVKDRFNSIIGYKNLIELKGKIAPFMIRRLKSDVLHELPPKSFENVYIEFSAREKKMYSSIQDKVLLELKELGMLNSRNLNNALTKMVRLKQMADSSELIFENDFLSAKLDTAKELLGTITTSTSKTIIFTQFKQMALILMKELKEYNPLLIAGGMTDEEKNSCKNTFQSDDIHKLLIMTDAGAFGLNLQRAASVIHYDLPWSISKVTQREDRAHRIGQTRHLMVYKLIVEKSVDEYILQILYKKQQTSDQVLGDTDTVRKVKISRRDVMALLS